MTTKNLTPYSSSADDAAPFDAIRETRADGSEFWSARRLMPLLGYRSWQNFQVAIARARVTAQSAGYNVAEHFTDVSKMAAGGGPPTANCELSRLAAYYVAVCSDDTKPEVQAAKTYFVHRTRQAEVIEIALEGANEFDLMRQQTMVINRLIDRLEAHDREIAEASALAVESSLQSQEALAQAKEAMESARLTAEQLNTTAQSLANLTAKKFLSTRKLPPDTDFGDFVRRLGREATRLCGQREIERTDIPHPEFGSVGAYPKEILKEAYRNLTTGQTEFDW
jgi:DNA-damage-inducible protein D